MKILTFTLFFTLFSFQSIACGSERISLSIDPLTCTASLTNANLSISSGSVLIRKLGITVYSGFLPYTFSKADVEGEFEVQYSDGVGFCISYVKVSSNIGCTSLPPKITAPLTGAVLDNGCDDRYGRSDGINWQFTWTPVNKAIGYNLYVKRQQSQFPVIDVSTSNTSYTRLTSSSYIADVNSSGWECKVRAKFSDGSFGEWSTITVFSVEPVNTDCPCIVVKSHPQSKAVCMGQSATFEASATINSAVPTTVKWQRNGVDVTSPVNYTPGSIVNYTTTLLSLYDNNAYYQAVFSNSCATIATSKAILNVDQSAVGGFALSSNITSAIICPNESKTITLTRFIGKVVKWQFSYDYNVWTDIPNSNSDKLVIKGDRKSVV